MNMPLNRREFLRIAAGSAAALGAASTLQPLSSLAETASAAAAMPTRPLGRTGFQVPLFSLGGQGLLEQPGHTDAAVAIINRALDLGVKYCDTAHWYGGGSSESYYGEALKTRRNEVYLATKSGERSYDGAMRDLETSLKRLQTDRLDCWQMHHVRVQDDVEKIFAPNGALKAFLKARDEKVTRFIGITGHLNPFVLKDAIGRFDFDTILMALNAADKNLPGPGNESSFIENLLPTAVEKKLGIIGMKVPAIGRIFPAGRPDDDAPGDGLHTLAAGEHGHHRHQDDPRTRGEHPHRADVQAADDGRDGRTRAAHEALLHRGDVLQTPAWLRIRPIPD